ncbi:hypothetical protein LJB80_00040 [Bacteroides sp. OttesenSCG-928-F21]|nr:hypothetical protein [Bacteroides sp. OttesenSCG-928-F21]
MKTEDLLTKYFDGETTCEEERELKRLFREEKVPAELEIYRPYFAFFEKETKKKVKPRNPFIYTMGGIAAGVLILLGVAGIKYINQPVDYIIIDGKKSADIRLAREQARAAFDDVSFSREDVFEVLFSE